MTSILGRYEPYVYAILRIVAGFTFLLHGTQKFFGFPPFPAGMQAPPMDSFMMALMTAAGAIELIAGLMIIFGFYSSIAAFIASGEMAVAYFMVHQPMGALPATNGGDAAVLFCFIFLYIAARGSGNWSVDSAMGRNRPTASDV